MRKAIYCLVALLTLSSCTIDGANHGIRSIGTALWHAVREDMGRVIEIFDLLSDYERYVEEEVEGDFREGYEVSVNGNVHTLKTNTYYGTSVKTIITMSDDNWHVVRTGGDGYDLTITLGEDGTYYADFETIYNIESTGNAEFSVKRVENGYAILGKMTMVDYEADKKRPLTIITDIVSPLTTHSFYNNYVAGELYIDCYDKRFNSHDRAFVYIDNSTYNPTVYINCYGEIETGTNNIQ